MRVLYAVTTAVITSLSLLNPSIHAQAVRAPRLCSPSGTIDLATSALSSSASIAVTGTPPTLWVLYSSPNAAGQDTVSLFEIAGIDQDDMTIRSNRTIAAGEALPDTLAVLGTNLMGAYVRPDDHIGIFVLPIAGGPVTSASIDTTEPPVGLSLAAVGNRALIGWGDNAGDVRFAWLDAQGQTADSTHTISGRFGAPSVVAGFGGSLIFPSETGANAHLSLVRTDGNLSASIARATANLSSIAAVSSDTTAAGVAIAFTARDGAHLALFTDAIGAGQDRFLGATGIASETTVAATQWGAFVAWTQDGSIRFMPVAADGAASTGEFFVARRAGQLRARRPVLAAFGNNAVLVWSAMGLPGGTTAIRLGRIECE